MNETIARAVRGAVEKFEREQKDPRILVIGATGAGKSSLINAIFGRQLHAVNTVRSTTRSFANHVYEVQSSSLR